MILYTSDGKSYEGMSQETVQKLRDELGLTGTFVTKNEYENYLASIEPIKNIGPSIEDRLALLEIKVLAVETKVDVMEGKVP